MNYLKLEKNNYLLSFHNFSRHISIKFNDTEIAR